jgi:hypothetical protein
MKLTQLRRLPKWVWLLAIGGTLLNPPAGALTCASVYLCSGPVLWLKQKRTK